MCLRAKLKNVTPSRPGGCCGNVSLPRFSLERGTHSEQPAGRRRYLTKKYLVVGLLCALSCDFVFAQNNKAESNVLERLERSVEEGKIDGAERPLLDYAVAHPSDVRALQLLGQIRYRQNRLPEAKSLFQRSLILNPDSITAKINLGRLASELGQPDEARRILSSIPPTALIAPSAQLKLAAAWLLTGDAPKALAAIAQLPLKQKNNEALPLAAAGYLQLSDKQKFNELIPLMKKAAATSAPLSAECAEILQRAGMNREAIDLLKISTAVVPNDFSVLVLLGRLEALEGDFESARRQLDRAAVLKPRSAEVLSAQAALKSAQGNSAAALDLLKQARELSPNSSAVLTDFVLTAMRANQTRMAVEAAAALLTMKPDAPEFQYLFGAASLQNGNLSAAEETLERFARARPADSRGCLALGLTLAAQSDRLDAARRQLEHCREIDPANFEATYQLGLSYKTQGETAKAINYLEQSIKQAPAYAAALRDLGALYLQSGAEARARSVLEKAVSLNAADADTHFQLSRLYNLIGESVLAKEHFEKFQKLKNPGGKTGQ